VENTHFQYGSTCLVFWLERLQTTKGNRYFNYPRLLGWEWDGALLDGLVHYPTSKKYIITDPQ
jgi:hypothetical protein